MNPSPYETVLGPAWPNAAEVIRAMHAGGDAFAEGRASVVRGCSPLARVAAALFGFPSQAEATPLRVRFQQHGDGEIWTRRFGDDVMRSRQWAGRGADHGLLCEAIGPLTFASALVVDGERLILTLRGWRILGLGLPLWLAPKTRAVEAVADGRFTFDIAISHPLTGLMVRYRGWLDRPQPWGAALTAPARRRESAGPGCR